MPFILDASVTLGWCFRDENQDLTNAVSAMLKAGERARVPLIWWFEIRHAALSGIRRRRVSAEQAIDFLKIAGQAPIDIQPLPTSSVVFDLARRHQLSFYDAAYLELAQRENLALATLDHALVRAAAVEGVALIAA
jgi:predicted nucleic acid-binding protein